MKNKSKPKPVTLAEVDTLRMVCGGEKKIKRIIHKGCIKVWVGIGWHTEGKAQVEDYFKYPEVAVSVVPPIKKLCLQPQKNGKNPRRRKPKSTALRRP